MNKKSIIIILASAIIALSGASYFAISATDPYTQQIKLGYKLIAESKYTEAILEFDKAITIDAKRDKAYLGLADTYIARLDENTVQDISNILKRAYEQQEKNHKTIVKKFSSIAKYFAEIGKTDWAFALLNYGYELTKDEEIKTQKEVLARNAVNPLLKELFGLCELGDINAARNIIQTERFNAVATLVEVDKPIIFYPNNERGDTKGLGLYMVQVFKDNEIDYIEYDWKFFLYYGDYIDNKRNGIGIWFCDSKDQYIFEGTWGNDKPNGEGVEICINQEPQLNPFQKQTIVKATYSDGFYNGSIHSVEPLYIEPNYYSSGISIQAEYDYHALEGIYQPMECDQELHDEKDETICYKHIFIQDPDSNNYSSVRSVHMTSSLTKSPKEGVRGFSHREFGGPLGSWYYGYIVSFL